MVPLCPRCYTNLHMRPFPLFTRILLSGCLYVVPGCSSESDDAHASEPAAPPASERPIPRPPAPPVEVVDDDEEPTLPAMDDRAANAAMTAAEHAPAGRDTCETAVISLIAMLDAAQSESPAGTELPRPHREDFVTACRALPQPAQQCLVPVHAVAHQQDCQRILSALPTGRLDALQAAMETQPNE